MSSLTFFIHVGSERPNTGIVTEAIETGIKSSSCSDIACQSSCRIDPTACDLVTYPQQQLLVGNAIASSQLSASSSPSPRAISSSPAFAHPPELTAPNCRQVARINANQINYLVVIANGNYSYSNTKLHCNSSTAAANSVN